MKKLMAASLIGGTAAALTVGAAPASAYPGLCYMHADGTCQSGTPDESFYRLLTDTSNGTYGTLFVMDFGLVKAQGLRACQLETNGMSNLNATYDLQYVGGYTFEQANGITSAADTIYCPWNQRTYMPPLPAPAVGASQDTRLVGGPVN